MENINFIQSHELFELNALTCLRNEYFFNECTLCFEQCEQNALGLYKGKIKLFEDSCTQCGECIGICPTQSLRLENFDVNAFVLHCFDNDKNSIVEKKDIPSLAMMDVHHLIALSLRKHQDIILEYASGISTKSLLFVQECTKEANKFLRIMGWQYSLTLQEQTQEINTTRRALFKNLVNHTQQIHSNTNVTKELKQNKPSNAKLLMLKNSLKLVCEELPHTQFNTDHQSLFFNKDISYDRCTNCTDCITFCPTDALFQNSNKNAIYFNSGKCIGCNICHQVCKTDAISENSHIDLIAFAFDKASKKVHFEYATCTQCNAPFVYKNSQSMCHRCLNFNKDFSSMFEMAKDL